MANRAGGGRAAAEKDMGQLANGLGLLVIDRDVAIYRLLSHIVDRILQTTPTRRCDGPSMIPCGKIAIDVSCVRVAGLLDASC